MKRTDICSIENDGSLSLPHTKLELDSYANMAVVGCHAFIISKTGKTTQVNPFSPDYEALKNVPIVDAALEYECPYSDQTYILVIRNCLHVPSMENNIIPTFLIREAGIVIQDVPKNYVNDPLVLDHSIFFKKAGLRIPLSLTEIFSYLLLRRPTLTEMEESDNVLVITPNSDTWDPHLDVYARNEEKMLDWEGHIIDHQRRQTILLAKIDGDDAMALSVSISAFESARIDSIFEDKDNQATMKHHPYLRRPTRWYPSSAPYQIPLTHILCQPPSAQDLTLVLS